MGKLFLLNTLIAPINFDEFENVGLKFRRITVDEAKRLIDKSGFESAIGHEATARVLSRLFGVEIPVNRRTIFLEPGDMCIHFFLKERLPEGKILSEEELEKLQYWLVLSEFICFSVSKEIK